MPCEFKVERNPESKQPKMVACGRDANYFRLRGQLVEIKMWLCVRHENRCRRIYGWEVKQLQPDKLDA